MQGKEADTWVAIKTKLANELNRQMVELSEKVELTDEVPTLHGVD